MAAGTKKSTPIPSAQPSSRPLADRKPEPELKASKKAAVPAPSNTAAVKKPVSRKTVPKKPGKLPGNKK
jgi:hypothetical protein